MARTNLMKLILGKNMFGSGSIKLFLLRGCHPPDPLLFLGGFQPPRPPGGACSPPCPSGLRFFWYQDLGSPQLVGTLPQAFFSEELPPTCLEAPNLWVRCRRRFFSQKMAPIFLQAPNLLVRCRRRFFSQKHGPHIFGRP